MRKEDTPLYLKPNKPATEEVIEGPRARAVCQLEARGTSIESIFIGPGLLRNQAPEINHLLLLVDLLAFATLS